jgi:mono/diheme cytochrome c family protein
MYRLARVLALHSILAAVAFQPALAQDVASYYQQNCAPCHTIGGGDQAGPDLKGATDRNDRAWLTRFLLDPEGVVASGDPYAAQMVAKWDGIVMPPTEGLTHEMAEALLDYIAAQSGGPPVSAPQADERPFTAADVARGRDLFTGRERLANGGPSCVSCHELAGVAPVSGGTLGPELTAAHARLGGRRGLTAWLARPPTPMMRAVYRNATLSSEEYDPIAALLEESAARGAAPARGAGLRLVGVGIAGTVLLLAAFGAIWARRFRGVRRALIEGSGRRWRPTPGGVSVSATRPGDREAGGRP